MQVQEFVAGNQFSGVQACNYSIVFAVYGTDGSCETGDPWLIGIDRQTRLNRLDDPCPLEPFFFVLEYNRCGQPEQDMKAGAGNTHLRLLKHVVLAKPMLKDFLVKYRRVLRYLRQNR